jgi:hypothetical protein
MTLQYVAYELHADNQGSMQARACTRPWACVCVHVHTHTQICDIYCFCTATMIRRCASVVCYMCVVCLVLCCVYAESCSSMMGFFLILSTLSNIIPCSFEICLQQHLLPWCY